MSIYFTEVLEPGYHVVSSTHDKFRAGGSAPYLWLARVYTNGMHFDVKMSLISGRDRQFLDTCSQSSYLVSIELILEGQGLSGPGMQDGSTDFQSQG